MEVGNIAQYFVTKLHSFNVPRRTVTTVIAAKGDSNMTQGCEYLQYQSNVLEHLLIQGFFFISTIFYIV